MRDFARACLMYWLAMLLAGCLWPVWCIAVNTPIEGWGWLGATVWPWLAAAVVVVMAGVWAIGCGGER
jgi:hypothetical protein